MGKIIIHNNTDIHDTAALIYVARVIDLGRISNDGENYCYATTFDDVVVYADRNKESDTFRLLKRSDNLDPDKTKTS